jgi:hypothetical protein
LNELEYSSLKVALASLGGIESDYRMTKGASRTNRIGINPRPTIFLSVPRFPELLGYDVGHRDTQAYSLEAVLASEAHLGRC